MALHHMWNPTSKSKSALSTQYKAEQCGHMLTQELFLQMLDLELLRTKRSGRRFILMVIESADLLESRHSTDHVSKMLDALVGATRATDITGWYKDGSAIGVIFTEIGDNNIDSITQVLSAKVEGVLTGSLGVEQADHIDISCQILPEVLDSEDADGSFEWPPLSGKQPGWSVAR